LRSSSRRHIDEEPPISALERPRRSTRPAPSRDSPQQRRPQRSEVTRDRNVRAVSQLFVSEDSAGDLEERNPRKKIKSTEQALREAREILKKREADRKKAAEKDAFEATLFRANAPPPKLFAAPSKLREQGFKEIVRRERGRVDRTFDPNLTNPIDRHQRTINRTNTVSNWDLERKVPTWEERMDYLRRQSPPRSRRSTLDPGDDGFDPGRAQTPIMDLDRGEHNDGVRIRDLSPLSINKSRSQDESRRFRRVSEKQGSSDFRNVRTLAKGQHSQPQRQPQPQPQALMRLAPPAQRPIPLPRGPGGFGAIRTAEAPTPLAPAPAPKVDWRNSEWMAQYQAQAEDDPFAKFYGN